jgi:hypothetical protein
MCKLCEELQFIDLEKSNLELQLNPKPGTNNMCILSLYQRDDYFKVAELKINYCPLCGRGLESN